MASLQSFLLSSRVTPSLFASTIAKFWGTHAASRAHFGGLAETPRRIAALKAKRMFSKVHNGEEAIASTRGRVRPPGIPTGSGSTVQTVAFCYPWAIAPTINTTKLVATAIATFVSTDKFIKFSPFNFGGHLDDHIFEFSLLGSLRISACLWMRERKVRRRKGKLPYEIRRKH